jgi:DHA3 family macrolide efflux protein-like MFS transporter
MTNIITKKNYLLYILIVCTSRMADVMNKMVLILFMLSVGGNATSIGFILITNLLPTILFGPLAGTLADKHHSKIMIYLCFSVKILIFSVIWNVNSYIYLYAFSFLLSITSVFSLPVIKNMLRNIVEKKEDILNINSTALGARSIIEIAVPILGSSVAVLLGYKVSFLICGLIYAISIICVMLLQCKWTLLEKAKESFLDKVREGYSYIFKNKQIKQLVVFSVFIMFFSSAINVLLPIHLLDHLKINKAMYGTLLSSLGLGSMIGSFVVPKLVNKSKKMLGVLKYALVFDGVLMILLGYSPKHIAIVMTVMFCLGITSSFYFIIIETHLQNIVEELFVGRVFSTYYMLINTFNVLSMVTFSFAIDYAGTVRIFAICGVGILTSSLILLRDHKILRSKERRTA